MGLRYVLAVEIVVASGPQPNFFTFKIIKEVHLTQLVKKEKLNQKAIIY